MSSKLVVLTARPFDVVISTSSSYASSESSLRFSRGASFIFLNSPEALAVEGSLYTEKILCFCFRISVNMYRKAGESFSKRCRLLLEKL